MGVFQTIASLVEDAQVKDAWAQLAPDLVPDTVAEDRRDDDDRDHGCQGSVAEAGGDASEDGRGLAGNHESDEEGVFDEDDDGDGDGDQPSTIQAGAFRIWL